MTDHCPICAILDERHPLDILRELFDFTLWDDFENTPSLTDPDGPD